MPYLPGILLVVKPTILKSNVQYYRSYEGERKITWQKNLVDFVPGDSILILDYTVHPYYPNGDHTQGRNMVYRIWVNGEEGQINSDVLEREDYYEVVK